MAPRKWMEKKKKPGLIKYIKPPGITQKLDISSLAKCWHKFHVLDDRTVLAGHFSERYKKYTFRSNGYQTPCNCMVAVFFSTHVNLETWTPYTIDRLLDTGDMLYHRTLSHLNCRTMTEIKLCQVYDSFYFDDWRITMTLKGTKYRGKLFKDKFGSPFLDNVIRDFFNDKYVTGIITTQNKHIAFWERGSSYVVFEPRDHTVRGHPWRGVIGLGYAVVMKLRNITALVDIIHENINAEKNSKFVITPCTVLRKVKVNTIPPPDFNTRHCEDFVPSTYEVTIPGKVAIKPTEPPVEEEEEEEEEEEVQVTDFQEITFRPPEETDEFSPQALIAQDPEEAIVPREVSESMIPLERARVESVTYFQTIVEDKFGILRSTVHQSDERFTNYREGVQSIANAFSALTMLRFHKSKLWLRKILDEVLILGEAIYKDTNAQLPPDEIPKVTNVCKKIIFKEQEFMPEVSEEYMTVGKLNTKRDDVLDLLPALEEFLLDHPYCIITGPISLAIWFEDGYFYMFDPNERDHNGLRIIKQLQVGSEIQILDFTPGRACVMWFKKLKDLVEVYMNNVEPPFKRDPFILSRVEIKDYPPEEQQYNNFKPICPGKWILSGTFNQNDRRFDKETRNTQCTAMSILALAYSKIKPINEWTTDDVDEILLLGDTLYKDSVDNLQATGKYYDSKLLVDEVSKKFPLEGREVRLSIEDCYINGLLDAKEENDAFNLRKGLAHFFNDYETAIVVARSIAVAVIRFKGVYYYFDSHSRDDKGIINNYGYSCVLRTSDIAELAKCIETNLPPGANNLYNITLINIALWELADDGVIRPPLNKFTAVGDFAAILRSTISSRSDVFTIVNRGKQGIPMCLAAGAMAKIYIPADWSTDILNEVLYVGDQLFTDTMVKREKTPDLSEEDDIDEVYPENCLMEFYIGVNQFNLNYKNVIQGNFENDFENSMAMYFNEPLIDEDDQKQMLVASDVYSVMVWIDKGVYYLFDPNPRDATGQVYGKEEWSLKYVEEEEEGEDYVYDLAGGDLSPSKTEATERKISVGSQATDLAGKGKAGGEELPKKHSARYWRQQEENGKALTMWFSTLEALISHILENTPPNKREEIIFKLLPLDMGNKPVLKEVFDPVTSGEPQDNYTGDWYSFKEIDHGRWILTASYDNTYVMYPKHNRGKQDLAMCYIAIGYAYHYDLSKFKTQTVNDILKYGDRLYSATRAVFYKEIKKSKGFNLTDDELDELLDRQHYGVDDIARQFCIGKDQTHVEITTNYLIGDVTAFESEDVMDVKRGLESYFEEHRFGILSAKDVTVAFWKGVNVYFMFDSASRGPSGFKCVNGEACITRYLDLGLLVDVFLKNLPKEGKNRFVIHRVIVRVVPCPKEFINEEPEPEGPKFISFVKIMPGKSILCGTISQEDPRFDRGVNAQSAAVAIVALTMTLIHKASLWTKPVVDDIVVLGDELYLNSIDTLGYEYNPWEQSLTLSLVNKDYTMGYMQANFDLRTMDQRGIIDIKHPKVLNLRGGIDRFFEENTHGVIETETLTVAIWEEEDIDPPLIYMYDPNPRGPSGMALINGSACVLTFESSKLLADHFISNIANVTKRSGEFVIIPVEICIGATRTQPPKCKDPCAGTREAKIPKICPNECERRRLKKMHEREKKKAKKQEQIGRYIYNEMPNGIAVLSGTRCQSSSRYSDHSRGNQDIPNCITAFVINRLVPVYGWHYKHLDMILDVGDTLYKDSYITYGPADPKLGFENVLRKLFIKDVRISLKFYKPCITAALTPFDIEISLMNYFQQETFGILSALNEYCAVFFKRGLFYIFDPNGRNREGSPCHCGWACLMRFQDLKTLAEKYHENVTSLAEPPPEGEEPEPIFFNVNLVTIGKIIKMVGGENFERACCKF